jgi:signal peptidase I
MPGHARPVRSVGRRRRPKRRVGHRRIPRRKSWLRELPLTLAVALLISLVIKTFLLQAFLIPSESMEDTLLVNDRVLVNKLADKPDEIHRGDVVVFHDPGGWLPLVPDPNGGVRAAIHSALVFVGIAPSTSERDLVKRVIGVGGDRIVCCDSEKRITVNGVPITEPYLYPGDRAAPSLAEFSVRVPPGRLWVMGDHRSESADSRFHLGDPGGGFVPVDNVVGRAFARVWPFGRAGRLTQPVTFRQARLLRSGK